MDCKKRHLSVVHVEEGPIGRTLFLFALPVIITQLLQELYNIADCAVVGHFAGPFALAAAGVAGLILSVLVNFFIGFSSGVSVITARLFGAYEYQSLKKILSSVIRMSFLAGIVLSAVGLFGTEAALSILKCPVEVVPDAVVYLRICLCGLTAQLIYNVGSAVLRSFGDTKTPMLLFMASAVLNLILDLLFVVIFSMGIGGAAIATLISQWLLAIALLIRLVRLDRAYSFSFVGSRASLREMLHILRDGIPAGMQALFMSISSLLIQVSINSFGASAIAGMTVYAKIEGCLYFPAFAYGIALTGFIGQNYGAGKFDRIRKATNLSVKTMVLIILPLSLLLMLLSPVLLHLFTKDPAILMNAREAVIYTFPVYVIYAVNQVYIGALKGLESTIYPMICTLVCYSIFRVIWCRVLIPLYPTMHIVYLSYDVSFLLMLLMLLPAYYRLIRKRSQAE